MAAGGEKPESSDPATTSTSAGDHDKPAAAASSRSSESSWGEPVESGTTTTTANSKSSPAAEDPEAYRIPSEVFARTKSSTPMEWSVASNESLFSIQMGNMSFTKDQAFLLEKSGEMGYDPNFSMGLGPTASPMGEHRPPKSNAGSPSTKPSEMTSPPSQDQPKSAGLGSGEPKAAETMREVIKENDRSGGSANQNQNQNQAGAGAGARSRSGAHPTHVTKDPSFESASLRRSSTASGASVKSFAFPILTGDKQHRATLSQSQPSTPLTAQQQEAATTSMSDRDHENNQSSQPATPNSAENKGSNNQNGTSSNQGSKWYACFPCCSSRAS
ncbi:hypothetical protein LINGRAHAP2_LOCUS11576 [Linum grandiflorum]